VRLSGADRGQVDGLVKRPDYDEYSVKYRDFFVMGRRDGIIELRMHRDDGPYFQTMASHKRVGTGLAGDRNDPLNHVLILNRHRREVVRRHAAPGYRPGGRPRTIAKTYEDAMKLLENFVFGVDIPTIAAVNGPGLHTEIALACDITNNAPRTPASSIRTSCYPTAPGDGQGLAFQELMGTTAGRLHMYTRPPGRRPRALDYGLVNEVAAA